MNPKGAPKLSDYVKVKCPTCDAPVGQACHGPIEEQAICSGGYVGSICLMRARDYMIARVHGIIK